MPLGDDVAIAPFDKYDKIGSPVDEGPVTGENLGAPYEPIISRIPGLLAFYDFSEPRAPFYSKAGPVTVPLYQGIGSTGTVARVTKSNGGPLGHSVVFDGVKDFLYAPAAELGPLNIGANGGTQVFILAYVKRTGVPISNPGVVAGIWQEDNDDPRRQYALFVDLPTYGGTGRVCMHVSKTGGASPNIPFSRDYSANGKEIINNDTWKCISGSYDGSAARSYVEGRFEPYLNYTEPGGPNGEGLTYDKNPYLFPLGLNTASADFTVGACLLTSGTANFFEGEIAALMILDRAPSDEEVVSIQEAVMQSSAYGLGIALSTATAGACSNLTLVNCYRGATAIDDTASGSGVFTVTFNATNGNYYALRNTTPTGSGLLAVGNIPTVLTVDNLESVSVQMAVVNIADAMRMCIKIGNNWYATEATYSNAAADATGAAWTNAEIKTITFARTAALWRDLTLTPGTALTLAGSARVSNLPVGDITGFGIYIAATPAGAMRFRNVVFKHL